MTPQQAAALLTVAAAFDNRKPDADAAHAWAALLDGLPFEDCRAAVIAHYRRTSDWLMPSAIVTAVQQVRNKRIAEAGDLTPPRNLTDEQERAWLGEARRCIADGGSLGDLHGDRKPRPELAAMVRELEAAMPRPVVHPTRDPEPEVTHTEEAAS